MRGKKAAAAVLLLALAVSLHQHSTRTALLASLERGEAPTAPAPVVSASQEVAVQVGRGPPVPRQTDFELAQLGTRKQGGFVAFDLPFVYAGSTLIGVLYVGGQLPPADFLDLPPNQASSVVAVVLSRHQPPLRFPSSIGRMPNLAFLVSQGSFEGLVPTEIGLCTKLLILNLDEASTITGSIPSELGGIPTLQELHITHSAIQSSVPSELCKLSSLRVMVLYQNRISGTIPPCLFSSISPSLLKIVAAELSGTIPPIESLSSVDLFSNSLTGPLPNIPATGLSDLVLEFNQLTGTIPTEYALIRNLRLTSNLLEGAIPLQLGLQRTARDLRVGRNALSGPIPSQLGLAPLTLLDIARNALTGTIPPQLGDATSLTLITTKENLLRGPIPTELGRLTRLQVLNVGRNRLSGSIPSQLGLLTNLRWLELSHNALSGTLPSQLLLLTSLGWLFLEANALSGPLVAPANAATLWCDFSGIDHPSCAKPTYEFVGDGVFAAIVAAAAGAMALALLLGAWVVAHRHSERVEGLGLVTALLTIGGVFVFSSSATWYALASVRGSHDARSSYCRAALHSAMLGMHLIVTPCAAHVALAWLGKRGQPLQQRKRWRAPPKRVLQLVALGLVIVAAFTTAASVQVEARPGHGCDYTGPSLGIVFVCPAALAAAAFVASAVSLTIPEDSDNGEDITHMRRALGTNTLFGIALVALTANLHDALPQFLSLSLAVLVSALTFMCVVHVPLVRAKW